MTGLLLYGFPFSANTHRVRMMLSLLDIACEERTVDLAKGEQFGEAFTAINPHRRVPVLVHDGHVLFESCAILIYLAEKFAGEDGERWWPSDPADRAIVAAWLFFTASDLHNGIGLARNERSFGIPSGGDYTVDRARASLRLLDQHLQSREYLALGRPTLADIAVYPFVAVAPEAGLALDGFPALRGWIERLAALPRFQPMPMLQDFSR